MEKKVAAVGSDALSLDTFDSKTYPCHDILLGHGIPIIENIANLKGMPAFSYVIGLFSKIKDGSGSPLSLVAFTEKEEGGAM